MKKQVAILIICGLLFGHMTQAKYSNWSENLNNVAAYLASMRAAAARTASEAWRPFARQYSSWFSLPQSQATNMTLFPSPQIADAYLKPITPYKQVEVAAAPLLFPSPQIANAYLKKPIITTSPFANLNPETPLLRGNQQLLQQLRYHQTPMDWAERIIKNPSQDITELQTRFDKDMYKLLLAIQAVARKAKPKQQEKSDLENPEYMKEIVAICLENLYMPNNVIDAFINKNLIPKWNDDPNAIANDIISRYSSFPNTNIEHILRALYFIHNSSTTDFLSQPTKKIVIDLLEDYLTNLDNITPRQWQQLILKYYGSPPSPTLVEAVNKASDKDLHAFITSIIKEIKSKPKNSIDKLLF